MQSYFEWIVALSENPVVATLAAMVTLTGGSAIGLAGWCRRLIKERRRDARTLRLAEQNRVLAHSLLEAADTALEQETVIEREGEFARRFSHAFPGTPEARHQLMHDLDRHLWDLPLAVHDEASIRVRDYLLGCVNVLGWDGRRNPEYSSCSTEAVAVVLLDRCLRLGNSSLGVMAFKAEQSALALDVRLLQKFGEVPSGGETGRRLDDLVVAGALTLFGRAELPLKESDRMHLNTAYTPRINAMMQEEATLDGRRVRWCNLYPNTFAIWFLGVLPQLNQTVFEHWLYPPDEVCEAMTSGWVHPFLRNAVLRDLEALGWHHADFEAARNESCFIEGGMACRPAE
ncbi:MAG: hypothetical protein V7704_05210 [Aurantimonas endophytica]|uniref:hypothetical protein n=1 Tax=Aurantimonas endophytica TaxID=1522175 RepID=UPI003001BB47